MYNCIIFDVDGTLIDTESAVFASYKKVFYEEVANDTCLQGLISYFDHVVCSDDTVKHKPNPEPLLKVIEKAGSKASKVLYIGDTYYDYLCARDAGVDFTLALWGAKNISDIHAKYNLQKPEDILELIAED